MKTALRTLLGVVTGMALAFVLVIAVELFSSVVHPVPPDTDTMDEMCLHVARYPHWVLGVVVLAWSATAFVSAWVATRIGNRLAGIAVILILTLAIVFNVSKLPYAMWFKVAMLICFPVACLLGGTRGVKMSKLTADFEDRREGP
jgi:MFS family permease